ncbi:MAG: hypothetical protein D6738_03370, partial [Acidobacteria bacterium]
AVPSVFDVGQTEWIFFEGLRTIQDTHANCEYCEAASFFPQTAAFTNSLSSPPSAYAPDGALDDSALRGRHWFERMNCSRCHSSATGEFLRTNDPDIPNNNLGDPAFGPLPLLLSTRNNLLHDATQSFVAQSISLRNMTDVGTRIDDGNFVIQGVNTPALANAWDAAPYLHDGRYRTLESVLEHTWLDRNDGYRAAPIWVLVGPPDNTDNALRLGVNITPVSSRNPYPFGTHSHGVPAPARGLSRDWVTVSDYLTNESGDPRARDDLLAYLRSVSSRTDACGGLSIAITNVTQDRALDCSQMTLSWNTAAPVSSVVRWGRANQSPDEWTVVRTPVGYQHVLVLPTSPGNRYVAEITAKWCDDKAVDTQRWNTFWCAGSGPGR